MKKVLVIFLAVSTLACRGDGKNSVTVSSGYFEGQYTNGQIANFGMELVGGLSRLDNYIFGDITDPGLGGWCGYFLFYVASQIVSCKIFGVPFHELGHGLRAKALGSRYALHFDSDDKTPDFKKDENFFKFFLRSVSKPSKGAYTAIDKGFTFFEYHSSREVVYARGDLKAEIIFCSGGINNEVFFAEKLADKFHKDGEIGFAESATISGFRSALSYSTKLKKEEEGKSPWLMGNDVLSLEACYKEAGIKVTASDIHRADWISWFLSGMTYSHFIGLWKGISNNRFPRVKALEFGGFRVPDTFAYLTSKGISYKMISGYKWQEDCRIIFAVERVFKGKSATELSLGINKSCGPAFWNASYEVVATVGEGFDLVASCSFPISKDFSINIGGGTYSTKSLLGERQAKSMKNGRSSDAFISMSYWY